MKKLKNEMRLIMPSSDFGRDFRLLNSDLELENEMLLSPDGKRRDLYSTDHVRFYLENRNDDENFPLKPYIEILVETEDEYQRLVEQYTNETSLKMKQTDFLIEDSPITIFENETFNIYLVSKQRIIINK